MNPKLVEAFEKVLGGKMRDMTPEEVEAIDRYLESIYQPTGINLFELLDEEENSGNKRLQ